MKAKSTLLILTFLLALSFLLTGCDESSPNVPSTDSITECAHSYDKWAVTTEATCTTAGAQTRTCNKCGFLESSPIAAKGHSEVAQAARAATCTATGLTGGSSCSVCGTVLTPQEVIPVKEHFAIIDAAKPATCTATGLTEGSHCSLCNAIIVAQEITPKKEHTPTIDAAKPATCTATGLTEGSHCSVCDAIMIEQQTIPALGHTEIIDSVIAATCITAGKTEGKHCSACNSILTEQIDIPALGHTEIIDAYVAATCTARGLTEGKHCSLCNTILIAQNEIEALEHTEVCDEGIEATCSQSGLTEGVHCATCNTILQNQIEIPKKEHSTNSGICEYCKEPVGNTISIYTAKDLIQNIGSNKTLVLESDFYNLSTVNVYSNPSVRKQSGASGFEIVNVKNLTIYGTAQIVIDDIYADVLSFKNCENIVLIGLTVGHTEPENEYACEGAVIVFEDCNDMKLTNCQLFGCGSIGLQSISSKNISVESCAIYDCTYSGIVANNSNVVIRNSNLYDLHSYFALSQRGECYIEFDSCTFDNISCTYLFSNEVYYYEDNIVIKNCLFDSNNFDSLFVTERNIDFSNCTFKDNYGYIKSDCSVFNNCTFNDLLTFIPPYKEYYFEFSPQILYDNLGITMTATKVYQDAYGDIHIELAIENLSDHNYYIEINDYAINEFIINDSILLDCIPGQKTISNIRINIEQRQLSILDFDNICSAQFFVEVFDWDNWESWESIDKQEIFLSLNSADEKSYYDVSDTIVYENQNIVITAERIFPKSWNSAYSEIAFCIINNSPSDIIIDDFVIQANGHEIDASFYAYTVWANTKCIILIDNDIVNTEDVIFSCAITNSTTSEKIVTISDIIIFYEDGIPQSVEKITQDSYQFTASVISTCLEYTSLGINCHSSAFSMLTNYLKTYDTDYIIDFYDFVTLAAEAAASFHEYASCFEELQPILPHLSQSFDLLYALFDSELANNSTYAYITALGNGLGESNEHWVSIAGILEAFVLEMTSQHT